MLMESSRERPASRSGAAALIGLGCFVAVATPFLFGYGTLPLSNFAGEIVSGVGFAMLLLLCARYGGLDARGGRLVLMHSCLTLLAFAVLLQYTYFGARSDPTVWFLVAAYFLMAAMAAWLGHWAHAGFYREQWARAMAFSFVAGGVLASTASLAQYFKVDLSWLVLSPAAEAGRTFGFVRQPNHQGTFLCLGLAALLSMQGQRCGRAAAAALVLLTPVLVLGVVSTGSRAALLQLLFLSAAAHLYLRQHSSQSWKALYPLACATLAWGGLFLLNTYAGVGFHGASKLEQTTNEGLGLRASAWRETLGLIRESPWIGSGMPHFGSDFFLSGAAEKVGLTMTHSHNLFLQLAYSFGIPLTLCITLVFAWIGWKSRHHATSPAGFLAFALIGCILIHSQVEFPLWYTYFLLPASYALGWLCFDRPRVIASHEPASQSLPGLGAANSWRRVLAVMLGAITLGTAFWMNRDYYKLTPVFTPGLASDVAERMAVAREAFWFSGYHDFLAYIHTPVTASNFADYLDKITRLGCVMYESWYQPPTIVALTYAGRLDEVRWILYSYSRLSGGKVDIFVRALETSAAPRSAEVLMYLRNPQPVARSTASYDAACFDGHAGR